MKKLILIRHGLSEGNQNRVIQSVSGTYNLTQNGIEETIQLAKENRKLFLEAGEIICSNSIRTMQTAQIIKEYSSISCEIILDDILHEMDAGILSGRSHDECKQAYKKYYDVWIARKDLDAIQFAESGACLQARALAFLYAYCSEEGDNILAVSHAGFIRCLSNTIQGISRTNPIDVSHEAIHVFTEPWKNLKPQAIEENERVSVYKVQTTSGKYILKAMRKPFTAFDYLNARIQSLIYVESGLIPDVYVMEQVVNTHLSKNNVEVVSFFDGEHKHGRLTLELVQRVVDVVWRVFSLYNKIKCKISEYPYSTLEYKVKDYLTYLGNENKIVQIGRSLLKEYNNYTDLEKCCFVLYDLHRDNILFYRENIRLIDLNSIVLADETYQLACILVSSFMMEEPFREYDWSTVRNLWPIKVESKKLTYYVVVRAFLGAAYFIKIGDMNSEIKGKYEEIMNYFYHKILIY